MSPDRQTLRVILASASPRRLEILRSLGLRPEVRPADVDEAHLPEEAPLDLVARLASEKVIRALASVSGSAPLDGPAPGGGCLVIAADTAVVLDDTVFGKPVDQPDASRMLSRLSGRTHEVLTGLAVLRDRPRRLEAGVSVTRVTFMALSPLEVGAYVATQEPMDKAGAYGIQAGGGRFVERIEGSYTNVVGLPIELLHEILGRFGLTVADLASPEPG